MSSDPDSRNEEELLSQIDELKARMDRLMSGGTSTSNSALLTDKPEAKASAEAPVAPPPGPNRTTVRDLIGTEDTEVIETYPGRKEAVPFPDDAKQDEALPPPPPEPESAEPAHPVGGSVIPLEDDSKEVRPRVSSFDDLGDAIQQELAKDTSVPPPEVKKGPDLASRFGPPEESAPQDVDEELPVEDEVVVEEELDDEPEVEVEVEAEVESEVEAEVEAIDEPEGAVAGRGNMGKVAAIWAITAIASGAIAALHFAGII